MGRIERGQALLTACVLIASWKARAGPSSSGCVFAASTPSVSPAGIHCVCPDSACCTFTRPLHLHSELMLTCKLWVDAAADSLWADLAANGLQAALHAVHAGTPQHALPCKASTYSWRDDRNNGLGAHAQRSFAIYRTTAVTALISISAGVCHY